MVKAQLLVVIGLPATSLIAAGPPVTVTVYRVLAVSVSRGLRIHWFVVPFRETTTVIAAPVAVFLSVNVLLLTPFTDSLYVVRTLAVRATEVAPLPGDLAVNHGLGR